jgi:hypothetical protein
MPLDISAIQKLINAAPKPATGSKTLLPWKKEEFSEWIACPQHSEVIYLGQNPVITLKTPLSSLYETKIPEGAIFEVDTFAKAMQAKPLDVGMVVDVTLDSLKYHKASEWDDWDMEYVKIKPGPEQQACPMAPTVETVTRFIQEVEAFWRNPENAGRGVAVFCTHGFNFAGTCLVAHMVQIGGMSVDLALQAFAASHAPGIFSMACIQMLHRVFPSKVKSSTAGAKSASTAGIQKSCATPPPWASEATKVAATRSLPISALSTPMAAVWRSSSESQPCWQTSLLQCWT